MITPLDGEEEDSTQEFTQVRAAARHKTLLLPLVDYLTRRFVDELVQRCAALRVYLPGGCLLPSTGLPRLYL